MHALHKLLLFHLLTSLRRDALGGKIINGKKVPVNSMLYMASLQNSRGHHICGGFLIREDFVLTAAHCQGDIITHVVLGTHDLRRVDDGKRISIECTYTHPSYVKGELRKDIMLLKLSEKVQLDNSVQTIELPTSEMNIRENEICQVAGWGMTRSNGKTVDELKVADVPTINMQVCENKWNFLPDNVICAGGYNTDKGFCQGDSGGPLVCNGKAVGIVSFNRARDCDYPNDFPNVYTDISKYLLWIRYILNGTE